MSCALLSIPMVQLRPHLSYATFFSQVLRRFEVLADENKIDFDDLLNRVKHHRCEVSFRSLFDHFYAKVLGYFQKNGIAKQKSYDLAQETLIAVWHKSSFFDSSKGTCSTWIFTIARNLRYDYFRSNRRDILRIGADDLYDRLEDPSAQIDLKLLSDDMRDRINSLSAEQKDAIRAMYFEGYSHIEYAELKKIPLGTVKSRIRLALAQLKKGLED